MTVKTYNQWHIPIKDKNPLIIIHLIQFQYGQCVCGCKEKSIDICLLGFGFFIIVGGFRDKPQEEQTI